MHWEAEDLALFDNRWPTLAAPALAAEWSPSAHRVTRETKRRLGANAAEPWLRNFPLEVYMADNSSMKDARTGFSESSKAVLNTCHILGVK